GLAFILVLETQMQSFRQVRNKSVYAMRVSDQIYGLTEALQELDNSSGKDARLDFEKRLEILSATLKGREHSPKSDQNLGNLLSDWENFHASTTVEQNRLVLHKLQLDLNNIGKNELSWSLSANTNVKKIDTSMQWLLAGMLIVNIMLCPILALYFSQDIL